MAQQFFDNELGQRVNQVFPDIVIKTETIATVGTQVYSSGTVRILQQSKISTIINNSAASAGTVTVLLTPTDGITEYGGASVNISGPVAAGVAASYATSSEVAVGLWHFRLNFSAAGAGNSADISLFCNEFIKFE